MTDSRVTFGRKVIYTDLAEITTENVCEMLTKALMVHNLNSRDIDYLYSYYRGKQPVLERTKDIRAEINNKVVVNRANEIVDFKTGYLVGEPIQYVNRSGDDSRGEVISKLNEFMFAEDKASRDKELVEWFHICGTAYRMALADPEDEEDESPFEVYTLDPRNTFVVYHSGVRHQPVCAVYYVVQQDDVVVYTVYTKNLKMTIIDSKVVAVEVNGIGEIPIVEYPANNSRLGSFEVVMSLLDAINEVASNRVDGVEQFIQALLVLKGVDIDSGDFKAIRQLGGLKLPADGDVQYLVQELNQTSTQTLTDDLYHMVLTICAMPSQADGSQGDSSNNGAVILRNGWQSAEARARDEELMFKQSEKKFLRVVMQITNNLRDMDVRLSDVDIRFTRRNYEDIVSKAQVLCEMLGTDKIHPKLAFVGCNMFPDAELAYQMSEEYRQEQEQKSVEQMQLEIEREKVSAEQNEEGAGVVDDADSAEV